MRTPFDLIQALRSWFFAKDGDISLQSGRKIVVTGANVEITTGGIVITGGNITVDGTVDGVDISAHAANVDAHHTEAHTLASHTGQLDHGTDLTGLADDDHTQYHNDTRGDARYYQQSAFSSDPGAASSPLKSDASGHLKTEGIGVGAAASTDNDIAATGDVMAGGGLTSGDATEDPPAGTLVLKETGKPLTKSGFGIVYFKSDEIPYFLNGSGDETTFYDQADFTEKPGAASAPIESDSSGAIIPVQLRATSYIVVGADAAGAYGTITFKERSGSPSTPSSTYAAIYVKTDGKLYFMNDSGTEEEVAFV